MRTLQEIDPGNILEIPSGDIPGKYDSIEFKAGSNTVAAYEVTRPVVQKGDVFGRLGIQERGQGNSCNTRL